jgi:hypothetical protein
MTSHKTDPTFQTVFYVRRTRENGTSERPKFFLDKGVAEAWARTHPGAFDQIDTVCSIEVIRYIDGGRVVYSQISPIAVDTRDGAELETMFRKLSPAELRVMKDFLNDSGDL